MVFQTEKAKEYTCCKLVSCTDADENLAAVFTRGLLHVCVQGGGTCREELLRRSTEQQSQPCQGPVPAGHPLHTAGLQPHVLPQDAFLVQGRAFANTALPPSLPQPRAQPCPLPIKRVCHQPQGPGPLPSLGGAFLEGEAGTCHSSQGHCCPCALGWLLGATPGRLQSSPRRC